MTDYLIIPEEVVEKCPLFCEQLTRKEGLTHLKITEKVLKKSLGKEIVEYFKMIKSIKKEIK